MSTVSLAAPTTTKPDLDKSVTCESCPSFVTATQSVSLYRKSIGVPVCRTYGKPLSRPGLEIGDRTALQIVTANTCPDYGKDFNPTAVSAAFQVALPDLERQVDAGLAAKNTVSSCGSCANFVRDDVVSSNFGWPTGMCSAKGKLILSNRQVSEAKDCQYRAFGTVRTEVAGIELLPEYRAGFGGVIPSDLTKAYFVRKEGMVLPVDYESDKPVSDQEKADGIRAWRAVPDPSGTGTVSHLPIYDTAFFDESEAALIPATGSDEHPELYVDHFGGVYLAAVTWTELDETPALYGEPGTGKTELFRHLAWLMNLPFRRVSITASTELDDLMGKMRYDASRGTYFQYGRLPNAWSRPGVLCLDEPNTGPPEVWQCLRPLTDNSKQLVLDMNEGEGIARHSDCYMGMAMNPAWDVKNVGTAAIGDADANRLFHVFLGLPPADLEREIIASRVKLDGWELSDSQMRMLMSIATDLRGLVTDGTLPVSWAIRPQIKVARALRWFDPVTAYRRAVGDYLEPEARQVLLDTVRSHIPGKDKTATEKPSWGTNRLLRGDRA